MRAALPLADPAVVLLDRLAMTRQPGPIRSGPVGQALDGARRRGPRIGRTLGRPPRADAAAGPGRRHRPDPATIASSSSISTPMTGWMPAASRGGGEPDGPVEALVIGDGEPGQAQLDGALDELVRGGRAVEEREVRVAVELGVGHLDRR